MKLYQLRGRWLEYRMQRSKFERGWQEGYSEAMDEADEVVEAKDAFIAEQSALIVQLMDLVYDHCHEYVDDRLANRLADYV